MPTRKRSAPDDVTEGRRRSGRLSITEQKSNYFESADEDQDKEEEQIERPRKRGRPAKRAPLKKKESTEEPSDYKDEEDEDELQANAEDDKSEVDESAPMKETIIPLEKMRDLDGVEYAEEKLHRNTLLFLRDLKANNKRTWLKCKIQSAAKTKVRFSKTDL